MVNEKRLLEEFLTLAHFDSQSLHEKNIADYLFYKLLDLGLDVSVDAAGRAIAHSGSPFWGKDDFAGNIYGFLKGNIEGEPILFSAHMDTVSPGNGKKPIVHEDGKVTSDGTTVLGADDVTGIVAILEMLAVVKENSLLHPDIEVVFFVAEELYCKGSSNFDFTKIKAKKAYTLDLDGKVGRIANAAPSIIQFRAEISGKSAHAGFEPEKGVSSILVATKAISGLKLGRVDENTTANIGTINGGTGKNIVPGITVIEGEVRSLEHKKALRLIDEIKLEFEKAGVEYGANTVFSYDEMVRAYRVDEKAYVIDRYKSVLNKLGYGEPEIVTSFGGSDNNNFCKYGIEGIVISNAMNKVHTVEEYFYVDELVKSAKIVIGLATT